MVDYIFVFGGCAYDILHHGTLEILQLCHLGTCMYVVEAAWVLLAWLGKRFSVVAAGAVLLQAHASSMEAEFAGFELALGSLMRLSRGYANVVPHDVQTTLDLSEYMEDKRRLLQICT